MKYCFCIPANVAVISGQTVTDVQTNKVTLLPFYSKVEAKRCFNTHIFLRVVTYIFYFVGDFQIAQLNID